MSVPGQEAKRQGRGGHRSCVFLSRAGNCHQSTSKSLVSHWPELHHMLFPKPLICEKRECRESSQVAIPSGGGARLPGAMATLIRALQGAGSRGRRSCLEV